MPGFDGGGGEKVRQVCDVSMTIRPAGHSQSQRTIETNAPASRTSSNSLNKPFFWRNPSRAYLSSEAQ